MSRVIKTYVLYFYSISFCRTLTIFPQFCIRIYSNGFSFSFHFLLIPHFIIWTLCWTFYTTLDPIGDDGAMKKKLRTICHNDYLRKRPTKFNWIVRTHVYAGYWMIYFRGDMHWNFFGSLTFVCFRTDVLEFYCVASIHHIQTEQGVSIHFHSNNFSFVYTRWEFHSSDNFTIRVEPAMEFLLFELCQCN